MNSLILLAAFWASPWIEVTPENGVKDDYYPLPSSAADGSFRYRIERTAKGLAFEVFVTDDRVVADDSPAGSITGCTTWTDDCLEVFFDGDDDRCPNTRGEDYDNNPTPCKAGGEYAIAANGAAQSDYASSKKSFGTAWGGTAEPWLEGSAQKGIHYRVWFTWEAIGLAKAPAPDETFELGYTICIHDDDDGGACDKALYFRGNPKYPFADESAFARITVEGDLWSRPEGMAPFSASEPFSPRVPVMLRSETAEVHAKDLRYLRDNFGLKRFIMVGPDFGRAFERASMKDYEAIGRKLAEIKRLLADTDIRIGWWCDPTFHAPDSEPWQRIMDCEGNLTGSVCPLDDRHIADYAAKLGAGLRLGRPDTIFIEDDFTLSNHAGMNRMKGCFCPLHMKWFADRIGRRHTPMEVATWFRQPTKENEPLRRAWADASRQSLVHFALNVRREIDRIAPETRVCQCQSGFVDIDGDSTAAITRAWAGRTRPLVRLFGAGYWDQNRPVDIAANIAHDFWSAQHLPDYYEMIHETDSYPHTRFYNSSLYLISELAGAMMAGIHDSYFYCLQYTDEAACDTGYVQRMKDYRKRLEVMREFRLGAKPVGVRMVYTPAEGYMVRETAKSASSGMLTASTVFLSKLGFPMMTAEEGANVATLFGNTVNVLSDEELLGLLKGGLFVDGEAAELLTRRGFADLIGAEAKDDVDYEIEFASERILDAAGTTSRGRHIFFHRMKSKPIIGWSTKPTVFAKLALRSGAVEWSAFFDIDGKEVAPAVYYFENRLGGRIGVMAKSVSDATPNMSFYTPRKQELFHNLFRKLSGDSIAITAPKTPGTLLIAAEKNGELMVEVNNLAGEPRNDIVFHLAPEWRGRPIERLLPDGTWQPLPEAYEYQPMTPEFIRIH